MRAIFFEEMDQLGPGLSTVVEGERAKHLIKSVRIRVGEEVLLMDGKGAVAEAEISEVLKKEVVITVKAMRFIPKEQTIDLLICLPKKDAFEDIVRSSVELGISKIIPCYSEYSQSPFKMSERYDRIIESGLIQSNNPYAPIIDEARSLTDIANISSGYDHVLYLSSVKGNEFKPIEKVRNMLLIIGPEGGLSEAEEEQLSFVKDIQTIHINCPIMRAPTAFNVGVGYIFGKLQ